MNKLLLLVVSTLAFAQGPKIPLEGLDPVALTQGRQEDGDKKFAIVRGQFQYLFANAANKAVFEKDPARYEIQLGGACARMGAGTGGGADNYYVYDGRIYIFGSADCLKHFQEAPEKYLEARQPAPVPLPASAGAVAKARKMLARAVEASGGAAAIDGLTSYQELRDANKETITIAYPNQMRQERTFNEKYHVQQVVFADSGFTISPDGKIHDIDKPQADETWRNTRHDLLMLLRARNDKSFHAAAIDDHSVAVDWMGERQTLAFDPASGRLLAVLYHGRGPGGMFGDIETRFADYRKTGDLILPYSISNTFNHDESAVRAVNIKSILVNPAIPADMFKRPQ